MIVAKPNNFGEAVTLLKQLQGRKAAEKGSEINLGIYNNNRRNVNQRNGSSNSGGGADVNRPAECPPSLREEPGSFSQEQSSRRYQNNQVNGNNNDRLGKSRKTGGMIIMLLGFTIMVEITHIEDKETPITIARIIAGRLVETETTKVVVPPV